MRDFKGIADTWFDVVIIGGGVTGAGILRDLSMRGLKTVLFEKSDLASGTSSRFHGLLHSGARYAVTDPEAAAECASENAVLNRIAKYAVEPSGGMFVRTKNDDRDFEERWKEGCSASGVFFERISAGEAREMEPGLTSDTESAYLVKDCAVDGFRLVWQNVLSAGFYGGDFRTYAEVACIEHSGGKVTGVRVRDAVSGEEISVPCGCVVNATGPWSAHTAKLVGAHIGIKPDKGALLAFNHRFCSRVVNRLRMPSDGDIFVPHGSVTIFGTTSSDASGPDDSQPSDAEARYLAGLAGEIFPEIESHRILRAFAGTRPLIDLDHAHLGRDASRNFIITDHEKDGLSGFITIFGGKLTTYRLMAEKISDIVCGKFFITKKCRTAEEELLPSMSQSLADRAKKVFPPSGAELIYARLGPLFETALKKAEADPRRRELLCECEFVTLAEYETAAALDTSVSLSDIRRRTRMGMGTCQGSFCGFRALVSVFGMGLNRERGGAEILLPFLNERWKGMKPAMWGLQMPEAELMKNIYSSSLNISGGQPE